MVRMRILGSFFGKHILGERGDLGTGAKTRPEDRPRFGPIMGGGGPCRLIWGLSFCPFLGLKQTSTILVGEPVSTSPCALGTKA